METLFAWPFLSATTPWLVEHPIAMLLFGLAILAVAVLLVIGIIRLGVTIVFYVLTFFLPFDFSRDNW